MDFDTMMRHGGTDRTAREDWADSMTAPIRKLSRELVETLEDLSETAHGDADAADAVRELQPVPAEVVAIFHEAKRDTRRSWRRGKPRLPAPQVAPCRRIAIRRTPPPRNRARSRPGGKWAARRA